MLIILLPKVPCEFELNWQVYLIGCIFRKVLKLKSFRTYIFRLTVKQRKGIEQGIDMKLDIHSIRCQNGSQNQVSIAVCENTIWVHSHEASEVSLSDRFNEF